MRYAADRPLGVAPATVLDYRELARRRLPRQLFDYIDGGAYEEATLRANVASSRLCYAASRLGSAPRGSVDRLHGHLHHARHDRSPAATCHQLAGPGDALSHSQPRNASPAISSS